MTPIFRVYGQLLQTDFPFKTSLLKATGSPNIVFSRVDTAPDYREWHQIDPVFNAGDVIFIYCCDEYDVFHMDDLADFYLFPDKIICHLIDPDYDFQVEMYFLGLIFSYWLEKHGLRALHAAAVNINGKGIAFLSTNAGGKSSLAATLTQLGHPLITDDILPVQRIEDDFIVHPSFPQMRMWPEVAEHFLGSYEDLELAHPNYDKRRVPAERLGEFCTESLPLGGIFLPERRKTGSKNLTIEPISPVHAMIDLMKYSFAASQVEAAGMQGDRFHFFGALVETIPVYKLIYPDGLPLLPDLCHEFTALLTSDQSMID